MNTITDLEKKISELNALLMKIDSYKNDIDKIIQKLEQQNKIEIPQSVADWIKANKDTLNLYGVFHKLQKGSVPSEMIRWFNQNLTENSYILARAWLDGYTIKQQSYKFPLPHLETTDGEQQYLTLKNGTFFASRKREGLKQSWSNVELKYVPREYLQFRVEVTEE
ncbi:TPA: DUF1642 domain-containing protein [Streptococcus suis]